MTIVAYNDYSIFRCGHLGVVNLGVVNLGVVNLGVVT